MTRTKHLTVALLASLALMASGCGSADTGEIATSESEDEAQGSNTGEADDTESDSTEDDAMEESTESDGTEEDAMEDSTEDETASVEVAGAGTIGEMLDGRGIAIADDAMECFDDRNVDLSAQVAEADEDALAAAELAFLVCNSEEFLALLPDSDLPSDIDRDQADCALLATFRLLGELPVDEAIAELDKPVPSPEFRESLIPAIADECGLDADQANALLDET